MRKGSGGAGGGAGLYNTTGLLQHFTHPHHHHHNHHHHSSPPGNMVQQQQRSSSGGNQNGAGRIFVSGHPHTSLQGPFAGASFNQSGLLLHHPPPPHHGPPHHNQPPQLSHRAPPILPGTGGFQSAHHSLHQQHHQFGPVASTGPGGGPLGGSFSNSHFSLQSSSSGGSGSGSGSGVSHSPSSHSSSVPGGGGGGGGGDMPPVETVVARLETACKLLHGIGGNNTKVAEISSEIQILSEDLRRVGAMLENTYPEVLDRVMSSMRDASAQPCLPPSLRLAIFELVELRASKWMLPSDSSNYYRQRRNLNDAAADALLEERSTRGSTSNAGNQITGGNVANGNVSVIVTNCSGSNNNQVKPDVIYPIGGPSPPTSTVETPPPPAKTYREEIVIKNSDSGKVAPTAKERVLSINGYSQQSINLAKQLIQETITRNASPVLEGMMLPSPSSSLGGEFSEMSGLEETEMGLKRLQLHSSSTTGTASSPHNVGKLSDHHHPPHHPPPSQHNTSHFSYTVTLGDNSLKILGDDLHYVQEAKMALDDYFLQKYPDLFRANNSIEDVEEEEDVDDEDFQGDNLYFHRYDRDTLLSLSKVKTPPPDFSHLEPDIRGNIVLEKRREFDLEKFARETTSSSSSNANHPVSSKTAGTSTDM